MKKKFIRKTLSENHLQPTLAIPTTATVITAILLTTPAKRTNLQNHPNPTINWHPIPIPTPTPTIATPGPTRTTVLDQLSNLHLRNMPINWAKMANSLRKNANDTKPITSAFSVDNLDIRSPHVPSHRLTPLRLRPKHRP
jgi:hypothetical protein